MSAQEDESAALILCQVMYKVLSYFELVKLWIRTLI